MKNKQVFIVIYVAALHFLCSGFNLPIEQERSAHAIMENIAECKFNRASIVLDSMISADTGNPLNWMLLMAAISLRQLDYNRSSDSDSFHAIHEKTKEVIAAYEKRNGADSFIFTIKGLSLLIAAAYAMNQDDIFSGVKMGFATLSVCKDVKKVDSANIDVDFIIGLYNYARAELKRKCLGILFWYPGDKLSGIRTIENCSRNSRLISLVSDMVLQEIYVRENMFDKAELGIDRLLASYPGSRFVLWIKAKLLDAKKKPKDAAEIYGILADAYEQIPEAKENYSATRLLQAERYYESGNNKNALEACDRILIAHKESSDEYRRKAKKLSMRIQSGKKP